MNIMCTTATTAPVFTTISENVDLNSGNANLEDSSSSCFATAVLCSLIPMPTTSNISTVMHIFLAAMTANNDQDNTNFVGDSCVMSPRSNNAYVSLGYLHNTKCPRWIVDYQVQYNPT